ncbi:MAG TPA: F0F1 ATP synthase subunit A [Firmicutes bacterium]|uniref:F0F1 ATP synthase subunit A n=1 Tax=Gelria sp. Kuro-4 TaxID=2796927 RepID=UPI0019C8F0B9|nr:F0F1 ATP synthase subunit A [Gelria sp. Kuro-4]MDI3521932.1 F-type H+-transporting ATPase subunit a [Bacillota bacterium]MDK2928135.1 F-type H+-transporting ATPase subunit a [Bacillota bacterium]BCV25389.1 ATP synthase subunit a [Gelria sp. Kuro-4]HHV58489.1 F0F1 ATP synthase subunit A [Bacillota bacterium]
MEELGPVVVAEFYGLPVTSTVVMSTALSGFIAVISFLSTRHLQAIPGRLQNALETVVELLEGLVEDNMGEKGRLYFPFLGTLFLYILLSNWMGAVPGLKSPTSDINVTVALAVIVLLASHAYGLSKKGLAHLHHFLEPMPLFLPLNIMEEITKPLSLAFRLFGNITGEHIVVAVLGLIVPLVVPVPMSLFGLFTGLIQALVFTMLAMVYIAQATEE